MIKYLLFPLLLVTQPVFGQEALYRFAEIGLNVVTAYHAQALPHELVHGATALAFGTETERIHFGLLKESISFKKTSEQRTRSDRFFTSMSAHVFTRYTLDLPRWIVTPTPGTYYDRWAGSFWTVGYMTAWITTAGSWVSWSKQDPDTGWDFWNAAQALSSKRSEQSAFLAAVSLLMAADAWFNADEIKSNFQIMRGKRAEDTAARGTSFRISVNELQLTHNF